MAESLLIVGLGNPGPRYKGTLHNAGREVAEEFASKHGVNFKRAGESMIARHGDHIIVLPETFMNLSGKAVLPIAHFRKIPIERILVLVDDLYVAAGSVKIRKKGSSGGHNGLKSIEQEFGSQEYPRIRIGIGPDPGGEFRSDYVLAPPRPQVAADYFTGKALALSALESVLARGVDGAMEVMNA